MILTQSDIRYLYGSEVVEVVILLIQAGASPLLDNDPQDNYLYEITVFTGSRLGAGTTSKVIL
mgnify:CR=1 FL=1